MKYGKWGSTVAYTSMRVVEVSDYGSWGYSMIERSDYRFVDEAGYGR